jgi:RNA recognition motif-containing protein
VKERELDDLFYKYGRIHRIDIVKKDRKAFAFIDFSERDRGAAEDAIYGRDRVLFDGGRLTVERSGSRRREEARDRKREPRGPITRTQHGVYISGLPKMTRWLQVKEHFIKQGHAAVYANTFSPKDNKGDVDAVLEFATEEEAERAVEKMHDTEFSNGAMMAVRRRSAEEEGASGAETQTAAVLADNTAEGRGGSRSRSRS